MGSLQIPECRTCAQTISLLSQALQILPQP